MKLNLLLGGNAENHGDLFSATVASVRDSTTGMLRSSNILSMNYNAKYKGRKGKEKKRKLIGSTEVLVS